MNSCCQANRRRNIPKWVQKGREIFAWALPCAILVSVPKCPVCLAAHVALWTGLGLSLSTATYLRWGMLCLGVALMFLVAARVASRFTILKYFK
jgi:hypothetical protein